jgi:hypothetical protein
MKFSSAARAAAAAMVLVLGLAHANAETPEKKVARPAVLKGFVVQAADNALVLKTFFREKNGEEVSVATNDDTKVTLDGKPAKLSDVKKGQWAHASPSEGTVTKLDVFTPKASTKPAAGAAPKSE